MENRIISKGETEQMFLKIKENKSYIFNPMEASGFHGVLWFMAIEFCEARILLQILWFFWRYIFYQISQTALQHIAQAFQNVNIQTLYLVIPVISRSCSMKWRPAWTARKAQILRKPADMGKTPCCQECSRSWKDFRWMNVWWRRIRFWVILWLPEGWKHIHLQQKVGKMCCRLSCRGTGWSSGALRLAAACLWSATRINWLSWRTKEDKMLWDGFGVYCNWPGDCV